MTLVALSALWVIAATLVAFLPMRHQIAPGLVLLLAAPVLIWMLGREFGLVMVLLALFAVVSMFRKPLRVLLRRVLGQGTERTP